MKKIIFIVAFAIISLAVTGCKKDKQPTPEEMVATAKEKVLGKWNYVSQVNETTIPPNPTKTTTKNAKAGDYWDFKNDGKLYYVMNGGTEKSLSYNIISSTEININGEGTLTIKELSNTRLVLSRTDKEDNSTYTTIINLSK